MLSFNVIYRELRRPLWYSIAVLISVALLVAAAVWFNLHMQRQQQQAEQALRDVSLDYRQTLESEHILRTQKTRFLTLRNEGFIGPEPRLRWIEDVREIAERADLVAVKYQLGARAPAPHSAASASYQLFASPMQLELFLQHEGDLLTFLQHLEGRRGGLFDLTACRLQRSADSNAIEMAGANLKAECELLWYSLDTPQLQSEEVL